MYLCYTIELPNNINLFKILSEETIIILVVLQGKETDIWRQDAENYS